jgi:hypothetical protein
LPLLLPLSLHDLSFFAILLEEVDFNKANLPCPIGEKANALCTRRAANRIKVECGERIGKFSGMMMMVGKWEVRTYVSIVIIYLLFVMLICLLFMTSLSPSG